MGVPSYVGFIEPLIRLLAEQSSPIATRDAYRILADRVGLTEDDRKLLLPSQKQLVYHSRIGWAHDRLKRANLSHSPSRAMWQLTSQGREFVRTHSRALTEEEVEDIAAAGQTPAASNESRESMIAPLRELKPTSLSPDERIEAALQEVRERVAGELLERIASNKPVFFEQLVLELLHAMGYGTSSADLQRVGKSGDGGIDGIISLDRLGLEKVYVQAKRWQNTVGRPDVQAFFGALAGQRATKGVFITTSSYSSEAEQFAKTVSDKIVLVDGARLTELMMECGVGVSHKPIRIPQIDSDYFEDG